MGKGKSYKMDSMIQAMQDIPGKLGEVRKELENKVIEGKSGGGKIVVRMTGQQRVLGIKVDVGVLGGRIGSEELEMLEDLVMVAVNDALENSAKVAEEEMGKVTGDLPPGLKGLI